MIFFAYCVLYQNHPEWQAVWRGSVLAIWYNMAMEQRDDIFDFGMMNAEDSLIDEVNPDWRDFADGGDELFWRCGCETDFVHPESLSVCPICGRERDI